MTEFVPRVGMPVRCKVTIRYFGRTLFSCGEISRVTRVVKLSSGRIILSVYHKTYRTWITTIDHWEPIEPKVQIDKRYEELYT